MSGQVQQVVAVMGRGVVEPATGVATGDDLGLTRGDGCFDATLISWDGEGWLVHDLDEHLARLRRSATALEITAPDDDAWVDLIGDALERWAGADEIGLKMVLTRGDEHAATPRPLAFLTLTAVDARVQRQRDGIRVTTLRRGLPSDAFADAPWLLGGVKLLSYAVNTAAKREAARRGADDVIFVSSDGCVLEGPTSAILWLRDGVLGTTPVGATGILDSVTKGNVRAGREVRDELVTVDELQAADAVWFISSVRGIAPVLEVDGHPMPQDPETTAALRALNGY